jgi:DNA-binding beta-propeller fold protein YncE
LVGRHGRSGTAPARSGSGHDGRSIYRVDPATNRARAVPVGLSAPDSLAVSDAAIWVASSADTKVVRLNPKTLKVVARVKVGLGPSNPAIAPDGSVFVPNLAGGTVSRIDPARNKVVATFKVGPKPFPAAQAFGDIWVPISGGSQVVRFHVG